LQRNVSLFLLLILRRIFAQDNLKEISEGETKKVSRKLLLQILIYTNSASVYNKMSIGTEAKQLQEQISFAKQENKQLRDTLEQLAVIISAINYINF
jgi:hypothetical protein